MDYGDDDPQTADQACVWLVGLWAQTWPTAYRLYASSVCDMNSATAAVVCGLWRYTMLCLCDLTTVPL